MKSRDGVDDRANIRPPADPTPCHAVPSHFMSRDGPFSNSGSRAAKSESRHTARSETTAGSDRRLSQPAAVKRATFLTGIVPAVSNVPPAIKAPLKTASPVTHPPSKPPRTPSPSGNQALPFHPATRDAATVPIESNAPPATSVSLQLASA